MTERKIACVRIWGKLHIYIYGRKLIFDRIFGNGICTTFFTRELRSGWIMGSNAGAGAPPVIFFSALSFSSDFDRATYGLSIHNG